MKWPLACAVQPLIVVTGHKHTQPTSNQWSVNSLLLGERQLSIPYMVSFNSHQDTKGVIRIRKKTTQ